MSTDRPDEVDGEVISRQLSSAEQLPMGMQLLKMENESIMSLARVAPRDALKVIDELKSFLTAYPAAAAEAVYAKPVGKVFSITCKNDKCKIVYEAASIDASVECPVCGESKKTDIQQRQKFAEGLSIRAAESIRSAYGYTRLAVEMEELPDGKVRIAGTLVDYAAGNMTSDERIISPFYKARGGEMKRTPEDRFLNTVVKAEKSKLRRDLILDSVPAIVKAYYRDACDEIAEHLLPKEFAEQKAVEAFAAFGMTQKHLEEIVGRPLRLGWTIEDNKLLRKLHTALKNGETTVAELLRDMTPQSPEGSSNPTKAATGDALKDITARRKAEKSAAEQAESRRADGAGIAGVEPAQNSAENGAEVAKSPGNEVKSSEADGEPQTSDAAMDASHVDQSSDSTPDELPEPYEGAELAAVVDGFKRQIESAISKLRIDVLVKLIHGDDRLPDLALNELLDLLADQRRKIGN